MGWFGNVIDGATKAVHDVGASFAQGYRSTAREVHDFVKEPSFGGLIRAPGSILVDMGEKLPGVGGIIHDITTTRAEDRSNWMRDNKAHLANKRLYQISMPGTHDSGTFDLSHRDAIDAPNAVSWLSKVPVSSAVVQDWAKAQELDFVGQLNAGVRYFDLRIGVSKHDGSLRIVHSLESKQTLRELIEPMGRWMHEHPDEIVILDIQHSHGLDKSPNSVAELIVTFRDIFAGLYVARFRSEEHATYAELIQSSDRVVILCDDKDRLCSNADFFIHRSELFANFNVNWEGTVGRLGGPRPANDDRKMYGVPMSFSPTENPTTADEYTTFVTSSLKKWGAEKQNPLGVDRLKSLPLAGRGWLVICDFPEYPNMGIIDYTINLNKW
ncbi:PLC-like phosphodiesterase [Mycena amicta]|nr:PLC-like phosphodiesterase [Mycena amicta]